MKEIIGSNKSTKSGRHTLHVYVSNICFAYSTGCALDLRRIANECYNVELNKQGNCVTMQLRKPAGTVAKIYASGKVVVTQVDTENDSRISARRVCRQLQKIFPKVKLFCNFRKDADKKNAEGEGSKIEEKTTAIDGEKKTMELN